MIRGMMYIDGRWVGALSGKTSTIISPVDQEPIAEVPSEIVFVSAGVSSDIATGGVFNKLMATIVNSLAGLVERDAEALAELESLNTGKTVEESRWDMADVAAILRYYGGLADKNGGECIEPPNPNATSLAVREPVGVCGQISPWNYPLLQASWKLAPALAAGCTLIVKPSEITPLTAIKIVELAAEAGYPAGVVNLVLGPGPQAGAELAENGDVDLISFTGGLETGRRIVRAAAANMKKLALELGGKNPNIVFADADFELAVDMALNAVFFHAGQICSAGARLLVEEPLYEAFVDELAARMRRIKLGGPFDAATQMGPVISAEHLAKVSEYVEIGRREGARLVVGGRRPEDPALARGFFYRPTLFADCRTDMRIVQEEVFGPVITVERFAGEAQAVSLANDTVYGLSAGFFTRDPDRIRRVSRALRFGTVWINDFNVYFAQAPWGGYKQSGIGRELGHAGLEEYTELKHIYQNHAPSPLHWFGGE